MIGQDGADGPPRAARAVAEKYASPYVYAALFGDGAKKAVTVGVIADERSVLCFYDGIAGAHLPAQGVKLVQILQDLHFVGLGNCSAGKGGHMADAVYDLPQMGLVRFRVEIPHIQPRGVVRRVLHTGGEGLTQRGPDEGYKFRVDVDVHSAVSLV